MNCAQVKERTPVGREHPPNPAEFDCDWEYTGDVFMCPDCGHAFPEPPYDFEVCPECGADFAPVEA
jgi:rubrerythrin